VVGGRLFFSGFTLIGTGRVICFRIRVGGGLVHEGAAEEDEDCVVDHEHCVGVWKLGWAG
jgi:hypothetical protein